MALPACSCSKDRVICLTLSAYPSFILFSSSSLRIVACALDSALSSIWMWDLCSCNRAMKLYCFYFLNEFFLIIFLNYRFQLVKQKFTSSVSPWEEISRSWRSFADISILFWFINWAISVSFLIISPRSIESKPGIFWFRGSPDINCAITASCRSVTS